MINIKNFKVEEIETTTSKWNQKKEKYIDLKVPIVETKTVYEQENIYDSFELYKHLDYWKENANHWSTKVKITFNVEDGE
tara:strand:- start:557 stop:796 length:240 start_codon:yes stop_codon:yes gene_type:complete